MGSIPNPDQRGVITRLQPDKIVTSFVKHNPDAYIRAEKFAHFLKQHQPINKKNKIMANKKKEPTTSQVVEGWELLPLTEQVKAFEEIKIKLAAKKKEAEEAVSELTAALN